MTRQERYDRLRNTLGKGLIYPAITKIKYNIDADRSNPHVDQLILGLMCVIEELQEEIAELKSHLPLVAIEQTKKSKHAKQAQTNV